MRQRGKEDVLIDRLEKDIYTADVLRDMKATVIERAMSGSKGMLEQFGDAFVNRAVAEIVVVSERYYSLSPLPPMSTSSPAYLEARVDGVSTVTGELTVPPGAVTVDAKGSVFSESVPASGPQAKFSAGTGGGGEEVTSVGGPGASLEHEVIRSAHDELGITDSATIADGDVHPTSLHGEFDSSKGDSE